MHQFPLYKTRRRYFLKKSCEDKQFTWLWKLLNSWKASGWKVYCFPKFKTKTNVPRYIQLAWFHRHTMHSSSCIHSTDVNWPPQILTGICCGRLGYIKEHHQPDFLPSVEVICGRDVMLWQPCSSCYEFIPVILKLNHSDVIGSHSYETTVFFLLRHHTTQDLAIFLFYWH